MTSAQNNLEIDALLAKQKSLNQRVCAQFKLIFMAQKKGETFVKLSGIGNFSYKVPKHKVWSLNLIWRIITYIIILHSRQVESDLTSAQNNREFEALLAKQKSLSQRVCARCGEGFSLLFNRRLECIDCNLGVCRKCCIWVNKSSKSQKEKSTCEKLTGWRCGSCQKER